MRIEDYHLFFLTRVKPLIDEVQLLLASQQTWDV